MAAFSIEGGAIQRRSFDNILDAYHVESFLLKKVVKGIRKHLHRASDPWVDLRKLSGHAAKIAFDRESV